MWTPIMQPSVAGALADRRTISRRDKCAPRHAAIVSRGSTLVLASHSALLACGVVVK